MLCQNIVNHATVDRRKRQIHYKDAERGDCILHTHDSFYEQVDALAAMRGHVTKAVFAEREINVGLNYLDDS